MDDDSDGSTWTLDSDDESGPGRRGGLSKVIDDLYLILTLFPGMTAEEAACKELGKGQLKEQEASQEG